MTASMTTLPVIGVPVALKNLDGLDSLLSIVQMPAGVPVATVAVGNARNAGLLAVRMLAAHDDKLRKQLERYQAELAQIVRDKDATVRAAAATAFAKPGAGRGALYRLQPLLQDSSPDVRAAAAGGLVRACGDLALPYVQPLLKERDDRALVAMAPELGHLKSPESANLLAKMMARPGGELRLAVTRGLAERKDDPGKELREKAFESIRHDSYASAELRGVVYAEASPDELLKQPRDPVLGPMGYKALLRAKRHQEAIDWLVANFDRLSPDTSVDLLATWLANPPAPAPTAPPKRAG